MLPLLMVVSTSLAASNISTVYVVYSNHFDAGTFQIIKSYISYMPKSINVDVSYAGYTLNLNGSTTGAVVRLSLES